jgi:hypothetical protein
MQLFLRHSEGATFNKHLTHHSTVTLLVWVTTNKYVECNNEFWNLMCHMAVQNRKHFIHAQLRNFLVVNEECVIQEY